MRIAFVSYEFPPDNGKGGIGTYLQQVAGSLAEEGWDVHVFAASSYREAKENTGSYFVHWVQCNNPAGFTEKVIAPFSEEHEQRAFEILECPEIHSNGSLIKKKYPDLPMVVRLHGPNCLVEELKNHYLSFFSKLRFVAGSLKKFKPDAGYWRSYRREKDPEYVFSMMAQQLSAPSVAMKNWIIEKWGLPALSVSVIPNIFNANKQLLEIPVKQTGSGREIVFFGRLNVLKGLVNATLAVKEILTRNPNWIFTVIGDDGPGPDKKESMSMWMQRHLQPFHNRVFFKPGLPQEELFGCIASADIILLPSLFESFSYTCLEAMSAGKAVIGSKTGGMADMIRHGENGMLADPLSVKEITAALAELVASDSLRISLGENARKTATEMFSSKKLEKEYAGFYSGIVSGYEREN